MKAAVLSMLTAAWFLLSLLATGTVFGMERPLAGEIEQLKKSGEFAERFKKAKEMGNHRIDPLLLEQALFRARQEALSQQGGPANLIQMAPPPGSRLMPTKGSVKVFALLIDFLDYPSYSSQPAVNSALFGDGSGIPGNAPPYESMTSFYTRSSYNQLDLSSGLTLGWYHAPYNRSAVPQTTAGREAIIKEAIASFDGSVDFTQFDNDGNGQIEYFIVIWTGPNNGWSNFWWGYQTSFSDQVYTLDGKKLGKYSWQWEGNYGAYGPFSPHTVIHETGHGLGLPDYYDYNDTVGSNGGVGGLDMMDGNWGDHNSFSKWVLEWLTPTVVVTGSQSLTLNPSGTSQDAALIMPGADSGDAFREFFIAQNRYRTGNDANAGYPADGMLLWHVDARLDGAGSNFKYDNSYTDHKLLKLMQADGLERIENSSVTADAAMYYLPGKTLTPTTSSPTSRDYQGVDSRVNVTGVLQNGAQISATFSIDTPSTMATLMVTRAGNGSGTVTSNTAGIACGSDCGESYLPVNGTVVILTAAPVPGTVFTGWSGGGCSGAGACTVTMTADASVTATFTTTLVLSEDFDPQSSVPTGWTQGTAAGSANWWFNYDNYNTSGGTGECALGATYGAGPYDAELRTPALNLSPYSSVGIEFKTSIESSGSIADVDVSLNGTSGPWTNVWRKSGLFYGPQTVNIDLSAVAAGSSSVMLRFRHTGTSIWWVIDDVKVMAAITPVATTTTVASGANPAIYGQSVTFTATVSPADATGTVTFKDGAATLGTGTLSGGSATFSTAALIAGSHSITAVYGSDSGHSGSTSSVLTQTDNPATLAVTAYAKSKMFGVGDPVLTYSVSGFVNGDTSAIMTGALTRVSGEAIGSYAILQGTLGAGANYTTSYTGANLHITAETSIVRLMIPGNSDAFYSTIAAAIGAVPLSSVTTLRLKSGDIYGDINFAVNALMNLSGGHDSELLQQTAGAVTSMHGSLTITFGTVNVDKLEIR